eukprot:3116610-Amphidinium_carterae.1
MAGAVWPLQPGVHSQSHKPRHALQLHSDYFTETVTRATHQTTPWLKFQLGTGARLAVICKAPYKQ